MIDRDYRKLERHAHQELGTTSERLAYTVQLLRVDKVRGSHELLKDRLLWNSASKDLQDQAISTLEDSLRSAFSLMGVETYSCGGQSHRIAQYRHNRTGILLNLIPGGSYLMGSENEVAFESPRHTVNLSPFMIGCFPVTQEQWDLFAGVDDREWSGPQLPIVGIDYEAVMNWLGLVGDSLRLPSESEWEYACRAGTQSFCFWGEKIEDSICWYYQEIYSSPYPASAHAQAFNAFGLIDMIGNVNELCSDSYIDDYQSGPVDNQPRIVDDITPRVCRGGNVESGTDEIRCSFREPVIALNYLGFRVVVDPFECNP